MIASAALVADPELSLHQRIVNDIEALPALSAERDALWARLEAASFLTDAERRHLAGLSEVGA